MTLLMTTTLMMVSNCVCISCVMSRLCDKFIISSVALIGAPQNNSKTLQIAAALVCIVCIICGTDTQVSFC